MKKGFTMIELIFVIVILGILASVAIPRLAGTRTDAEVSAAVANIRTLISDAASYYAVKGSFDGATWKDVTNVPIGVGGGRPVQSGTEVVRNDPDKGAVYLSSGGIDCIVVRVRDREGNEPAHIEIAKVRNNRSSGICPDIIKAEPIQAFLNSKVPGIEPIEENENRQKEAGIIALESSISIHQ